MKALVRLFVIAGLVAVLGCWAYAAEVQGILLDRMCATKIVADQDQKAAQNHTRECALMPDCVKAGYGVFTPTASTLPSTRPATRKRNRRLRPPREGQRQSARDRRPIRDTLKVTAIKIL